LHRRQQPTIAVVVAVVEVQAAVAAPSSWVEFEAEAEVASDTHTSSLFSL